MVYNWFKKGECGYGVCSGDFVGSDGCSSCCGSSSNEVVKESQFKKAYDYAFSLTCFLR